jgi:NAD(P)-dependent dehydrogenase (short-subunit alcohol dehydrogenase family)
MSFRFSANEWGLILGGSSGFGLATAKKLARHGMNVAIVHRDRRGAMAGIEREFSSIRESGVELVAFNLDALSEQGRRTVLAELSARLGDSGRVRLLMHSIAYGNLKLLAPPDPRASERATHARALLAAELGTSEESLGRAIDKVFEQGEAGDALSELTTPPGYDADSLLEEEDFARTVHSMGTSLATWAQELFSRRLFAEDARVVGMTSEGNELAWRGYAAVSAAKVALESVVRSLAVELGPFGIRANVVQAGVTDTPALRLIPGAAQMKARARRRNPLGRLTKPEDVADFICLLCTPEARWVNGALIRVDGGEHVAG